ncbi:MAG TPA: hypothetical protein VGM65_09220 [Candidatus Udaeobacter sp.]
MADDFKTINGKKYKNATVSRVEPDGIVIKYRSGIAKVYFAELPKDVQERFQTPSVHSAEPNADLDAIRKAANGVGAKRVFTEGKKFFRRPSV